MEIEQYTGRAKKQCQEMINILQEIENGGISLNQEIEKLAVVLQHVESLSKIIKGRRLWLKT